MLLPLGLEQDQNVFINLAHTGLCVFTGRCFYLFFHTICLLCSELMRMAFRPTCHFADISDNEMQMKACGNKLKAAWNNIFNSVVEFYFHIVIRFILGVCFVFELLKKVEKHQHQIDSKKWKALFRRKIASIRGVYKWNMFSFTNNKRFHVNLDLITDHRKSIKWRRGNFGKYCQGFDTFKWQTDCVQSI